MKTKAFTLLELLVALTISTIVIGAISGAFTVALRYARTTPDRLSVYQESFNSRAKLEQLFKGATITADTNDQLTYFTTGTADGDATEVSGLTFTSLPQSLPGGYLLDESDDFADLNTRFGPQGGTAEVSLSLEPVGDAPQDQTGLFLRIQNPSDGDLTQGGFEELLIPGVTEVTYEFWDGLDWVTTWDTQNGGSRRLPPAVRLTLSFEEEDQQILTFRIPSSDITAANPLTTEGGTQGP
jgi:prepilin-type N-terminal cleavage/methylation domain-containing protein